MLEKQKYTFKLDFKIKSSGKLFLQDQGLKSFTVEKAPDKGALISYTKYGLPYIKEFYLHADKWTGADDYQFYYMGTQGYWVPLTNRIKENKFRIPIAKTSKVAVRAFKDNASVMSEGTKVITDYYTENGDVEALYKKLN